MPTTNRLTATLLALSLAAACGDNDKSSRTLEILMPDGEMPLCSRDDESTTAPGLQDSVTVRAIGFRQGDLVTLDIVTPQGAVDPQPAAVTMNNEIVFSNVTLPEGSVVLQARAGDVTSPTVVLTVDTAAPELQFIEPTPGANPERISRDDDLDTADLDIDFEVVVTSDVADGEVLHLRATPPSGTEADLGPATVADGQGSWEVPFNEPGLWSLTVEGMNDCGNTGTQTVEVFVDLVAPECRITIIPEPLDITGVPLGVLNASNDPSPDPDFQAMVTVSSEPGATVTLFLDDVENASMIAGASGMVTFDLDLAEDTDLELRATCSDAGGNIVSSTPEHVLVDITPPGCMISDPNDGAVLTPADDVDDVDPDVDFDVVVTVDGGDVEGQPVNVDVDGTDIPGTVVGGSATARASKNSADPSVPITLTAQDRAGNLCTDTITVSVDLAGCPIEITGPTGTVFTDADPSAAGMQVDVTVANSDMDCNGRTVELTNCDVTGTVVGTLAAGAATIRATFCSADQCEQTRTCTATVTEAGSGIVTSDSATIVVDTLPPQVTMSIINPAVVCGSTITAASDIDGSTPGVQVQVRLLAAAPTRYFEVTPDTGPPAVMYPADVNGFATITIGSGQNTIVAFATDASGTGMSTPCTLRLSTLGVTITSPLNGQTLGAADGTVSGSDLVIQVCGTVTDGTATVNVSVDGGSPVAAIVTGTTWCA
jgi:hypothetical protein